MTEADDSAHEDPRVARTRQAVLEAAYALLVAEGSDGVTHARVAEIAQVGRATVYRHWPDRQALLAEALSAAPEPELREAGPDTHSRLVALLENLRRHLTSSAVPALTTLVDRAEWNDEFQARKHSLVARMTRPLVVVLDEACARGELPATLDRTLAVAQLAGVLFFRRLLSGDALTTEVVTSLVDDFLGRRPPGT